MSAIPMRTLQVELAERRYPIFIGSQLLGQIPQLLPNLPKQLLILTNTTVAPLYLEAIQQVLSEHQILVHTIADGEQYKSLATFTDVMDTLIDASFNRDCAVLALGGGVVGDLAGFIAATYQRGVDFYQIPTTLLADVDSSVGGKTAVNHPHGKNLIGAFYQPKAVIIDLDCLRSLPEREYRSGLAEVLKYGIIHDAKFFTWLEENASALSQRNIEALAYAVERSCAIKAEVVALDERENGIRALLNLGHTFAHAIEGGMDYGTWLHGEAVAAGIVIASNLAMAMQLLDPSEYRRIVALTESFGLPTQAPRMSLNTWLDFMQRDKKVKAGRLRFVLPTAIGSASVTSDVDVTQVEAAIAECSN